MTRVDVSALVADARNHLTNGSGCSSCVDGIESLAASLADAEATIERVRALAESWEQQAGPESAAWRAYGPQTISIPYFLTMILAALAPEPNP